MDPFLQSTPVLNFDNPGVSTFIQHTIHGISDPKEKAVKLYYAVRDGIRYNPYHIDLDVEGIRASVSLERGFSWCVGKAVLLTAACRGAGIPARLGFADVRNYMSPPLVTDVLKTNIFFWHGFSLLFLNGKWVKATPAFDAELCDKHGFIPVEFDGEHDAVFHSHDRHGRMHIQYLNDRGAFDDLPLKQIHQTYLQEYGKDVLEILLTENHPVKQKIREAERNSRS